MILPVAVQAAGEVSPHTSRAWPGPRHINHRLFLIQASKHVSVLFGMADLAIATSCLNLRIDTFIYWN